MLSDECAVVGMVQAICTRSSASAGSPSSSRPNSSATGPSSVCSSRSAAASRGVMRSHFAARGRPVKPAMRTQSLSAESSVS